ncbi:hypothetical protein FWC63_02685 [Candidatus Saccharibacteria bacterium]|nr:hypothetical protein [Candidatus Saccharibacteria bacterium]
MPRTKQETATATEFEYIDDYNYVIPSSEARKAAQKRGQRFGRAAEYLTIHKQPQLSQRQRAKKMRNVLSGISDQDAKRILNNPEAA